MVAFWCIIVVKVSVYQIYYHSKMETMAQGQAEQERKIQSPRGTIMDRDGRVLAISEMAKSLYADPAMIQKPTQMIHLSLLPMRWPICWHLI